MLTAPKKVIATTTIFGVAPMPNQITRSGASTIMGII